MKKYYARINGREFEVEIEEAGVSPARPAQPAPQPAAPAAAPAKEAPPAAPAPAAAGLIASPMPGQVLRVLVKPGEAVKRGQVLLVLEAMKMENEIMAPADGTVAQVHVAEGAAVNTGDALLTL